MKLTISGAAGRMGRALLESLFDEEDLELGSALEKKGHPAVGRDAGELIGIGKWGVSVTDRIKKSVMDGEVIIDFTYPLETLKMVQEAQRKKRPMVIGTTGFLRDQEKKIKEAAKKIPIVWSPNMSVGVNVMLKLLSNAASILGEAYDVEIMEIHHRHKKDAPSGTALRMGETIAVARGSTLTRAARFSRHGKFGPRKTGEIGFQSQRAGDVVGEHTVVFAGPGERIEMTHRAQSRNNFSRGAILAAKWVVDQPPGLYDMMDVLSLK
ncbi:MAG: 4-hydroxy-tetrahydrodipicolinate reductase [Nitrospira sp.]|nr:4-hydroxy-tetrahydrodipicolinate reductase [Candidatus Manganitrophaceae bacterium]HIL33862.1 4-hydroxy-tetrahydrodipicolinate reductase [Candidatus Manganitrophaceae bacterium]